MGSFSNCRRFLMEKTKSDAIDAAASLQKIHLDPPRNLAVPPALISPIFSANQASDSAFGKKKPQRLVSLCIGVLGQHFEDIVDDLSEIAAEFPADIKLVLLGIARRRQLLNDNVLFVLAETLWEILDVSGSEVTDIGLSKVAEICPNLKAVDISRCEKITVAGVTDLFRHCHSLATLRCGGSPRSDFTARRCLNILKPKLDYLDGESWEELEIMDIGNVAQSLRWLVWPKIDEDSKMRLATECPRICVNPQGSIGIRGVRIPVEAQHSMTLDHNILEDIDPKTWAVSGISHSRKILSASIKSKDMEPEMSMAEKFRLAFVERDARLAPKRAKNERQHRRRQRRSS